MNKREFLKKLGGGSVVAAGVAVGLVSTEKPVEAVPIAPVVPDPIPTSVVTWPCVQCQAEIQTPTIVWDSVKLRMSCPKCGRRQPYLWHLKKFDPAPVEYSGSPGHPLATLHDSGPSGGSGTFKSTQVWRIPDEPSEEFIAANSNLYRMTPRERSMKYFSERRARKRSRRAR
jgi:hypothetical protein